MLPSLPAFVEDLNLGDCQFEIVGESDQQDEEQLFNTTMEEMQKLLFTTDSANSDIQYLSVPPGLVFNNLETDEIQQRKSISSSVIPLYVQQEQLDNIDAQTATLSSYWMDDIQPMSSLTASTNAFQLQMPAEYQTSPEATDQTVPFRRRENVCSMVSSCSEVKEVKRERECSVSESSELLAPSSSLLPTALFTPPPTSQVFNHIGRRGRPCLNDVSVILVCYHPRSGVVMRPVASVTVRVSCTDSTLEIVGTEIRNFIFRMQCSRRTFRISRPSSSLKVTGVN